MTLLIRYGVLKISVAANLCHIYILTWHVLTPITLFFFKIIDRASSKFPEKSKRLYILVGKNLPDTHRKII